MAKSKVLGKSPTNAFLRLNRRVWNKLPPSVIAFCPVRWYGNLLHTLVRLQANRNQNFGTLFFRNRPQLELIRRLSDQKGEGSTLKITVLACSKGAEVYSILYTIRSPRPDLKVIMHAVDISEDVLKFAEGGAYSLANHEFANIPVFGRMTEEEIREMFEQDGDRAKVKQWIKEGIIWHVEDAGDPEIVNVLGPQEIVVANNFLCHMNALDAERCLRNISGLVAPGGYLFVSGIDLDVRAKVALDLEWKPLRDLIEDIHDGDSYLRLDWPWEYWGLEPFNKRRNDWKIRYASAFLVVGGDGNEKRMQQRSVWCKKVATHAP
jgi:SAM-dependent methyltransferase